MSAFALMMALAACSNEEITTTQGGEEALLASEDVIEISLTNTSSRTARPVGSSAADNNVDKVVFKFYVKNSEAWENADGVSFADGNPVLDGAASYEDGVLTYTTAEEDETVPGTTDSYSKKVRLKMKGLEKNKEYRIVAYGYNNAFPYGTVSEDGTTKGLLKTGTFSESTKFSVEEVFAGYVDVKTKEVAKFTTTPRIVLERQVAGMLAYFKNVPAYVNNDKVEKVVVKANAQSTGFQFPAALMSANKDLNGLSTSTSATTLLTFTITSDNASNFSNANEGDTYTFSNGGKNYVLADGMTAPTDLKLLDNTLFGGRFILPYASHVDSQTLTVELQKSDGTVLRTLKVKTNNPVNDDAYKYDIRCNNFYSIGKKLATDDTTGGEGENPEPEPEDPDEPVDLSATDEITVTINDAWEVLHNMDVE